MFSRTSCGKDRRWAKKAFITWGLALGLVAVFLPAITSVQVLADETPVPVVIDGRPPIDYRAPAVLRPLYQQTADDNTLSDVPAYDWSFGCSATSAAMLIGYYDRHGYPNMYTGTANNGVAPLGNCTGSCDPLFGCAGHASLSATEMDLDCRSTRGHVDDYWIAYGDPGPDPWIVNSWVEHTHEACTGDFMGTNQSTFGNIDGGTTFWFYTSGSTLCRYNAGSSSRDGAYGLALFVESRGYTVLACCNQYIQGVGSDPTKGFTFDDYRNEIDAGRPVLIQVTDHTMLGLGYDATSQLIYLHDTWDCQLHSMTWGGAYWTGSRWLQHYGVTYLRLGAPPPEPPAISSAVSRKAHGTVNSYDIDVKTDGAVECRSNGPTQVIVPFNQTIQGAGGLDPTDVVITNGTVGSLAINGSELTINVTGATNAQPMAVAFPGIVNTSGVAVTNSLCFGALAGDVNASRTINSFDLTSVRGQLGQTVGQSNFTRDVNCTDTINSFDLTFVRARLGTQVADCSPMALIPAGEFQMGDTFSEGDPDELPVHAVYVDAFFMDRYEVTNQQYADALNWAKNQGNLITVTSGMVYKYNSGTSYPYCDTTTSSSSSRITWSGSTFGIVSGKENHPMVQVSWYGSVAYANWRSAMQGKPLCYDLSTWECNWSSGYRLPTEAEWEKAARGGAAGHRFPWSDTDSIQHARANYVSSPSYCYDTSPTRDYHPIFNTGVMPYTSPVGYFASNSYGLYDMAGNVWKWCNDWYSSSYYSSSPYNNPHGPASGTYHVLRGGAWGSDAISCRVACRLYGLPGIRGGNVGFRLALDSP